MDTNSTIASDNLSHIKADSRIAVVICNYNGGKDIIECIKAVRASDFNDIDIIVVDNASTDGSPDEIKKTYDTDVNIIRNSENLGGAGGFGRGMRFAIEEGYHWIMTIDSDAFIFPNTVSILYSFICEDKEIGAVGAKIMKEDDPNIVFDYAKVIDFDQFHDFGKWNFLPESEETLENRDCDYVAATVALYRASAVEEVGGIDEGYFIYFDDIDLCYRLKLLGYRVVCHGTAKAKHKSSMAQKPRNTFTRYYSSRNKYYFYAKYSKEDKLNDLAKHIIKNTYNGLYAPMYKGRNDVFITTKYILIDFITGKRGRADKNRIVESTDVVNRFLYDIVPGKRKCLLLPAPEILKESIDIHLKRISEINPQLEIDLQNSTYSEFEKESYDLIVHLCTQLRDVDNPIRGEVYLDIHNNVMSNERDFIFFKSLNISYDIFETFWIDLVKEAIYRVRQERI